MADTNNITSSSNPQSFKSKADKRKMRKVLVERRRRERMDRCLEELKFILVGSKNTRNFKENQQKLEKADILEMTVRYIRHLHRQENGASQGFRDCMKEVNGFLRESETSRSSESPSANLRPSLMQKLREKMTNIDSNTTGCSSNTQNDIRTNTSDNSAYRQTNVFPTKPSSIVRKSIRKPLSNITNITNDLTTNEGLSIHPIEPHLAQNSFPSFQSISTSSSCDCATPGCDIISSSSFSSPSSSSTFHFNRFVQDGSVWRPW